jgi:hypothetical protein
MTKLETKLIAYLSHRPRLYALIVGVGIVLFWRGVWHTADQIHTYLTYNTTIDWTHTPWWDGPLSLLIGLIILYFTGAFVSSFIGNELILSGLRGEKRLNEKTEVQVENEVRAISDIKESLRSVEATIEQLEKKVLEHHQDRK